MEIKQLRHFLAVAQTGSFSKAAILLGVAQPMLSRQIRCLEQEMGIDLVYRNGRGAVLTEAGRVLADRAGSIVESVSDATSTLRAMQSTPIGEVVIGIPPMIGTVLTVPVVERFRAEFPKVLLHVVEAFSGHVMEWLAGARLDVAVVYNVARTSVLSAEPLLEEDLLLVASSAAPPVVQEATVRAGELGRVPLVLPSQPHGLRSLVDHFLADLGVKPNIVLEVDGFSAILRLVEHGAGATILSHAGVQALLQQDRLRAWPIVEPRMSGQLYVATSTQRPVTAVTRALARIVRQEMQALVASGAWKPHTARGLTGA
ncbi:MAG TPA: LysR family transcriptional regulator [Rhodopila sp.]|nr:LysR family transcriptional regulator [Rhodopila sp.]